MEGYIKVRKGSTETEIMKKNLKHYINNGWVMIEEEEKPKPKRYDNYTVKQLKSICSNRNILPHKDANKADIVSKLIIQDEQSNLVNKPSNKGFTDNLILE